MQAKLLTSEPDYIDAGESESNPFDCIALNSIRYFYINNPN